MNFILFLHNIKAPGLVNEMVLESQRLEQDQRQRSIDTTDSASTTNPSRFVILLADLALTLLTRVYPKSLKNHENLLQ